MCFFLSLSLFPCVGYNPSQGFPRAINSIPNPVRRLAAVHHDKTTIRSQSIMSVLLESPPAQPIRFRPSQIIGNQNVAKGLPFPTEGKKKSICLYHKLPPTHTHTHTLLCGVSHLIIRQTFAMVLGKFQSNLYPRSARHTAITTVLKVWGFFLRINRPTHSQTH